MGQSHSHDPAAPPSPALGCFPGLSDEEGGSVTLSPRAPPTLPMRTEKKNWDTGMFKMGAERFRNQFGVMGNSLRNNRKKNKQLLFSSTCQGKRSKLVLLLSSNI